MAFKSLQHVLGAIDQQPGWHAQKQFQQLIACWFDIVGPAVAAQTRPVSVQRQVLQVATSGAAWAQNLSFERQRILQKLNSRLGTSYKDIRFSTAQWQRSPLGYRSTASELEQLWQSHPSRIQAAQPAARSSAPSATPITDPNVAFQHWSQQVQRRSQQLPLCPSCACPTPPGELLRWSICSLCAAKQWSGPS